MDPLELLPPERELVLDVVRILLVVGELLRGVPVKPQALGPDPEPDDPFHPLLAPELEPFLVRARLHKELHLHLLEFAGPEYEVARRDLVSKCLADLGDPEWDLLARRLEHVHVIDVDALRRLRTEIHYRGRLFDRPHEGLEHEIEHPGRGQSPLAAAHGTLCVGLARRSLDPRIVRPEAVLALPAIHQRVREAGQVARRLPDLGMHENGGVEPLDVVALVDHGAPPALLDVLLELYAERPVVPHRAEAAVDLRRLKHEPASLG